MPSEYTIKSLPIIAILFLVGIVAASIMGEITADVEEETCDYNYDDGDCRKCPTNADTITYNASGNECYNSTDTGIAYETIRPADFNITNQGKTGIIKIANWFTTIGLVLGAVIVITALGGLFYLTKR